MVNGVTTSKCEARRWFVQEKKIAQRLTQSTRNALQMQHVNADKSDTTTQYKKVVVLVFIAVYNPRHHFQTALRLNPDNSATHSQTARTRQNVDMLMAPGPRQSRMEFCLSARLWQSANQEYHVGLVSSKSLIICPLSFSCDQALGCLCVLGGN